MAEQPTLTRFASSGTGTFLAVGVPVPLLSQTMPGEQWIPVGIALLMCAWTGAFVALVMAIARMNRRSTLVPALLAVMSTLADILLLLAVRDFSLSSLVRVLSRDWISLLVHGFPLVVSICAVLLSPARTTLQPGQCRSCSYDLTGNLSGICSECGAPRGEDVDDS